MKVITDRDALLSALAAAKGAAATDRTNPILVCALMITKGSDLKISATNMLIAVEESIESTVKVEGMAAVEVKRLHDVVRTLPSGKVTIETLDNHWVRISSGKSKFKLAGHEPENFPEMPAELSKSDFVATSPRRLSDLINRVAFAMSTDQARVNLHGALLSCEGDTGRMVATDGHRLVVYERSFFGPSTKRRRAYGGPDAVMLPRAGVLLTKKMADRAEGEIEVGLSKEHWHVRDGSSRLVVKLAKTTFPPWSQVMPKPDKYRAGVEVIREEMLTALRSACVLATEKTALVVISVDGQELEIKADNPETGTSVQTLDIEAVDESFFFGVNGRYMIDMLEVLAEERVMLHWIGDLAPVVVGPSDEEVDFRCVVMPMRI